MLALTATLSALHVVAHTHICYALTHTPNEFPPGWREIISGFALESRPTSHKRQNPTTALTTTWCFINLDNNEQIGT